MRPTDFDALKHENRLKICEYIRNPENGRVSFYPAYLQIEQTNRCNANCIMCNHFYLGNRGCSDLSGYVLEQLSCILPYSETIVLNGDGEPFLSPSLETSLKTYRHFGIKVGTNTNLSVIPEYVFPYFKDTFSFLNISCDAAAPKTYEMIRAGLSFKTFTENLTKLEKEVPELVRIFDCVVMKQNLTELPEIVDLAHQYGIKKVKFQRLGVNPVIENQSDEAERFYDILTEQLSKAKEEGDRLGVEVVCPEYDKISDSKGSFLTLDTASFAEEIDLRKQKASKMMRDATLENDYFSEKITKDDLTVGNWCAGKVCKWAVERCYVDLKGNVSTCCFNIKKNFGSLMNRSFDEIWNGEEYITFRENMAKNYLPDFCKNCNWIKDSVF